VNYFIIRVESLECKVDVKAFIGIYGCGPEPSDMMMQPFALSVIMITPPWKTGVGNGASPSRRWGAGIAAWSITTR
jgi:hypothetical protein